jgi:hypothetical protein
VALSPVFSDQGAPTNEENFSSEIEWIVQFALVCAVFNNSFEDYNLEERLGRLDSQAQGRSQVEW